MQFIVLMSPTVKNLIIKYQGKISFQGIGADIFSKIKASKLLMPSDFKAFINILTIIRKYLVENSISYQRESIKKLVGDGMTWKGLFNIMLERGDRVFICPFDPNSMRQSLTDVGFKDLETKTDTRVLMPLNLDENPEILRFFHEVLKLPVYPFLLNIATSKWLKGLLFAPYAPRAFYFPEGTNTHEFEDRVIKIAKEQGIEHLILKDEYDLDIRPMIPYIVIPAARVELACRVFYEHVKGIPNFGGLVLEEFISTKNSLDIFEAQVFGKVVRGLYTIDKISLKPIQEGGPFDTLVLEKKTQFTGTMPANIDAIDAIVGKYYPYLLSSIEFIVHNGTPKVIDVNNVSNSLRFDIVPAGLNPDVILKHFLERVSILKNEDELGHQIVHVDLVKRIYEKITLFGPAFFDRGRITSLVDGQTKDIREFLEWTET